MIQASSDDDFFGGNLELGFFGEDKAIEYAIVIGPGDIFENSGERYYNCLCHYGVLSRVM